MSELYHRKVKGTLVRMGKYSDTDFAIYIGNRLYASIDCIRDAYILYNEITEDTVANLLR